VFWSAVLGSVVVALGGYYAFEASVPDCGPPRNTTLGQIYWFVPLAILLAQSGVVAVIGRKTHRTPGIVITALVLALLLTLLGGALVLLHFYGLGDCGE
jgi:hypothetical protein